MSSRLRRVLFGALILLAITAGSASAGALVTSARIKDDTVGRADVRDGSLSGLDVRDGSLGLVDLAGLERGPKGPAGFQGFAGSNGVPDLAVRWEPRTLQPDQQLSWLSACSHPTEQAASGGVSSTQPDAVTIVRSSVAGFDWGVEVLNESTKPVRVYAWAMCVDAPRWD